LKKKRANCSAHPCSSVVSAIAWFCLVTPTVSHSHCVPSRADTRVRRTRTQCPKQGIARRAPKRFRLF
jgi:hypothetical protein